jgi:hypothetical protein
MRSSRLAIAGAAALMLAGATSGVAFADIGATATYNGAYTHTYTMTSASCGVDGTITFGGTGTDAADGVTETISGVLNTTASSFTLEGTYDPTSVNPGYTYSATGALASGGSGVWNLNVTSATGGVTTGTGSFTDVPNCQVLPVAGNHGQFVSGATKAGVKGQALAAIARNGCLIGTYYASTLYPTSC